MSCQDLSVSCPRSQFGGVSSLSCYRDRSLNCGPQAQQSRDPPLPSSLGPPASKLFVDQPAYPRALAPAVLWPMLFPSIRRAYACIGANLYSNPLPRRSLSDFSSKSPFLFPPWALGPQNARCQCVHGSRPPAPGPASLRHSWLLLDTQCAGGAESWHLMQVLPGER